MLSIIPFLLQVAKDELLPLSLLHGAYFACITLPSSHKVPWMLI